MGLRGGGGRKAVGCDYTVPEGNHFKGDTPFERPPYLNVLFVVERLISTSNVICAFEKEPLTQSTQIVFQISYINFSAFPDH